MGVHHWVLVALLACGACEAASHKRGAPKVPKASHFHPHARPGSSEFATEPDPRLAAPHPSEPRTAADSFRFSASRAGAYAQVDAKVQRYSQTGEGVVNKADPADLEPLNLLSVAAHDKTTPYERYGASSVIRGRKLYVFGGMSKGSEQPSQDLLVFDLDAGVWSVADVYGSADSRPPGRIFHSASLSEDGSKMYVTGGTPCFARIFQKSLSFDDANGQYVPMLQHATTETTSIEHSMGFDDVYAFDFATGQWTQLKPPSTDRKRDCHAATNVYYNAAGSLTASPLVALSVVAAVVCSALFF